MRATHACDGVGVDAEPVEVRGVKVEAKGGDSREERVPLLGGIEEIAWCPGPLPADHGAVLDHQAYALLAGVVRQLAEDPRRLGLVLAPCLGEIVAHERAGQPDPEQGRGVDHLAQVAVDDGALVGVGGEVVLVVGERADRQA